MPAKYNTKYNTNREIPSVYADYKLSFTGSSPVTCTNKEIGLKPRNLGIKPFFLFFDNRYHGIKAAKYTPKPHKKHKIQHEIHHGKLRIFLGFELLSASGTTRAGNKKKPRKFQDKTGMPEAFLKA